MGRPGGAGVVVELAACGLVSARLPGLGRVGALSTAVQPVSGRASGQEGVVAECAQGWRIAISAVSPGQYRKAGGLSGGFGGGGRHRGRSATARKSTRPAWHRSCLMVEHRCECA